MGDRPPSPELSLQPEAKVAIPRLKRSETTAWASKTNVRPQKAVSKACTQCRKRKTRCSGETPQCQGCIKLDLECRYDQARRDRLREALQRNHILTELLKDSPIHDDRQKRDRVVVVLKAIENDSPPTTTNTPSIPIQILGKRSRRSPSSEETDDDNSVVSEEALIAASAGCYEDLDFLEEDLLQDREISGTGYVGRESPVQWLQSLHERIEQSAVQQRRDATASTHTDITSNPDSDFQPFLRRRISRSGHFAKFYFYLDSVDISLEVGDPNVVPSVEIAGKLYKHYRSAVHDPLRILGDTFVEQLRTFYIVVHGGGMLPACSKWKACMNLVFAIGARYAELTNDDSHADDHNHLVYMWRAVNLLELRSFNTLVAAPDLLLIQATGLLAFYYLTIGHVSRAWYTIGISIRHAQAAGLHLKHEDPSLSIERKTTLSQTWWALHSIETTLTAITGRPRVISLRDITAIPPGALRAKQRPPTNGNGRPTPPSSRNNSCLIEPPEPPSQASVANSKTSFLNAHVEIDLILHKVLLTLYSPRTSDVSWKQTQKQIAALLAELEEWALQALPHGLLASTALSDIREHFSLYLHYGSAKIYITRPCLCRLDLRNKGQSEESAGFNRKTAETCVQAAIDMCSKFPKHPDPKWLYDKGPWWSSVHIIMQTVAVLLHELSRTSTSTAVAQLNVVASIDKLTQWLQHMKVNDGVSERAYNIVRHVRSKIKDPSAPNSNTQRQDGQDPNSSVSPSCPKVPTQPLFATTYAPFDVDPAHQPRPPQASPQQPPPPPQQQQQHQSLPYLQANPTPYQINDYFGQINHTQGFSNLQPLAQHLDAPQDGSAHFSQDQMSVSFGDPFSTGFDQYSGWENTGFVDWMAQDCSWSQQQQQQ
ncbi:hypothetical protein NX059_004993 [Plenodomus lindquistii]|nr:hypothetical protein NX059_004993 [Plenodomus lindquistii]